MRKANKIAVTAAGLVLAGGAAATAVTAPPQAADKGITIAEEHTGTELPATKVNHPTKADHPSGASETATETDAAEEGTGPVDNHGAEVSTVAQDDSTTGREHGQAVSEVASDGRAGGSGAEAADAPVATPNEGGVGTGTEASDGANEVGSDYAADQAAAGSGNAGDHRRP